MPKEFLPINLNQAQIVFGAAGLMPTGDWEGNDFMPSREDIPEEFLRHQGTPYNKLVSDWFFKGLPEDIQFYPKEGIDPQYAFDHIRAIMGSWAPKHEHKEAACAYLISLWYEDVLVDGVSILEGGN